MELSHTASGDCCTGCLLRLAMAPDAEGRSEPGPPPPPGLKSRFFGDYEIRAEIAHGGMGVVYEARQLSLNRPVALKMVQASHLLSAEARLRFSMEIESVAQLSHPHIVPLYESGEYEGTHFFTMKLVKGGNLSDFFRKRPPVRDLVLLLIKVCRAVHYAHQRGILHRDLKPSNILVDEQGEPHVADFGLAKSVDQESGFTFTSTILGSPNYMAPEQASHRSGQLTTAVDVYGLGAILFEALAGRPPFQAPTPLETIRRVVDTEAVAPRKFNPVIDADLEVICLKCLNKEPTARYGTAEDLARDLERWRDGEPILARPLGTLGTAWRWAKRHPAVATLGLGLLAALASIVVGVSYAAVQINRAEQRAAANLRESLLGEARVLRLGGNLGRRDEGLRLIQVATGLGGPPEFRWKARNELASLLARTDMTFIEGRPAGVVSDPDMTLADPEFKRIVAVDQGTNLVVYSTADGAEQNRFTSPNGPILRLEVFSPEGRFFAARQASGLGVWDLKTGERCLFKEGTNQLFFFTAGVGRLALQVEPYKLIYYRVPTGEEMHRLEFDPQRPGARETGWHIMAVSPERGLLAASSGPSRHLEIINTRTRKILHLLNMGTPVNALAWSSDSERLAVATLDGRITVLDVETTNVRTSIPPTLPAAHRLAFDPSHQWLAAAGGNQRVQLFELASGRLNFELRAASPRLSFDASGKKMGLLFEGDRWGWLESARPTEFLEFPIDETTADAMDCHFSADGAVLLSGNLTKVAYNDVRTGAPLGDFPGGRITASAFDPSDNQLLLAATPGMYRFDHRINSRGRLALENRAIVHEGRGWRAFVFSQDGQWFAAANIHSNAAFVFDRTLTNTLATLGPHPETDSIAISPDGRWVTTGSYHDRSILIWDVANESMVRRLPVGRMPRAVFSGDGKWIATYGDALELRETGTWNSAPPLPFPEGRPALGAATFSPDGRLLAIIADHSTVHLIDLHHFQSVGILRPPVTVNLTGLAFSPDGSKLAAVGVASRAMIWNLEDLRRSLAQFDLDWDGFEDVGR